MTTKKMATKRPPRQFWFLFNELSGVVIGPFTSRKAASRVLAYKADKVTGPYVLAERVRQA